MNAHRLLAHYEMIADAPDAIPRIRRLILDLAISGRIVPQAENELLAGQTIKPFSRELGEFPIPAGWAWSALGDIGTVARGGSPRPIKSFLTSDTDGIPWIKIGDSIKGSLYIDKTEERIRPEGLAKSRMVYPGDLLLSNSMSFGQPYITQIKGCIHDGWLVIRTPDEVVDKLYLHKVFLSNYARSAFSALAAGAVVQNLNADKARLFRIPLPPLSEQRRIVAKVDELMGFCDRLDANLKQGEERRSRLTTASFARLSLSEPETFQRDARFVLDSLPVLTARPVQIAALREATLNLAVTGKLTPQSAKDEPASVWLRKLIADPLIKDNKIEQPLFSVPAGWIWVSVADVFEVAGGIQKTPDRAPRGNAFPYLGVGNVYRGRLDLTKVKEFELEPGEIQRRRLAAGDLLIIEGNGSFDQIGRCAKWRGEIADCVHQNHVIRCRPVDAAIVDFVLLFLNSEYGIRIMQRLAITSSGLYSLSVGKIRQIDIPIPPLPEQSRIVAKVDQLMELCDQLERSVTAAIQKRSRLLNSLLAEALQDASDAIAA